MLKVVTLPSEGWYPPAVLLSVTTQKTTTQEPGKFTSPRFIVLYLVVNYLIKQALYNSVHSNMGIMQKG